MKYLYHITEKHNLESILRRGLIKNFKRGMNKGPIDRQDMKVVFLTNDPIKIAVDQGGYSIVNNKDIVIFKIDISKHNIKPYVYNYRVDRKPIDSTFEFVCENDITPQNIVEWYYLDSKVNYAVV